MKLIVLSGQTSSGKSDLAVDLALILKDACIVGCDSRQVYKDLNLGTGKVEGKWINGEYIYRNVKHYLIDFVDPNTYYSLSNYLKDWCTLFVENRIPEYVILTGGTGLYSKAVIENFQPLIVTKDKEKVVNEHKAGLNDLPLEELQRLYKERLTKNNKTLNESDFANPRRLQNWLLKEYIKVNVPTIHLNYPKFEKVLHFAIDINKELLKEKIYTRFLKRIEQGMVEEITNLNLSSQRFLDLGLEYRVIKLHLTGVIGEDWRTILAREIWHYAKRQMTWLKAQKEIIWIKNLEDMLVKLK